jgi:hypothetical protein
MSAGSKPVTVTVTNGVEVEVEVEVPLLPDDADADGGGILTLPFNGSVIDTAYLWKASTICPMTMDIIVATRKR